MNPFKTKRGLGRGLSSLIGDTKTTEVKNLVSISSIVKNKFRTNTVYYYGKRTVKYSRNT